MKAPTKSRMKEALETIASYPLPVFEVDGRKLVPAENAEFLRTTAKEALEPERKTDDE